MTNNLFKLRFLKFGAVLVVGAVSGCTQAPVVVKPAEPDPVAVILERSANSVAESLQRMNDAESTVGVRRPLRAKPLPAGYVPRPVTPVSSEVAIPSSVAKPSIVPANSNPQSEILPTKSALDVGTATAATLSSISPKPPTPVIPQKGLKSIIAIAWVEDSLEDLVAQICHEIGWVKGPSVGLPLSPKRVSVYSEDKTAMDILTEVGNQVNRSADIVISEEKRTIYIRYPIR